MRSKRLDDASPRKKRLLTASLLVALALVFASALMSFIDWTRRIRDYSQAEPLVQTIWPMANEMKRFHDDHGRSPNSLDEIDSYSSAYDFSALRVYSHEFAPTSSRRFFLRVNRRFAFAIDDRFIPSWVVPPERTRKPLDTAR
jgi:hypothetical protein